MRWRCEERCGYYVCEDCYETKVNEHITTRESERSPAELLVERSAAHLMPAIAMLSGAIGENSDSEEENGMSKDNEDISPSTLSFCCPCCFKKRGYETLVSDETTEISAPEKEVTLLFAPEQSDPMQHSDSKQPMLDNSGSTLSPKSESSRGQLSTTTADTTMTVDLVGLKVARIQHKQTIELFSSTTTAPAVGGIEVTWPHSKYLLPPEVVLFEPSEADIVAGGKRRLIFLNTRLREDEQKSLGALHDALEEEEVLTAKGDAVFPSFVRVHALRVLQQAKNKIEKAKDIFQTHLNMRVKLFPLRDTDVLSSLKKGLMYWHGRDRRGRPCLVWNLQRMDGFILEDALKLVLFVLEYGIRYCMVPGRVESYILIVDLDGVGLKHSNKQNRSIAKTIGTLLAEVYCGRNFCTKLMNVPWIVRTLANSFIPEDKKEKVQFLADKEVTPVMKELFESHQLEQKYGGSAPNTIPEDTYPFQFFPNPMGQKQEDDSSDTSLHEFTSRQFHEGLLWDESSSAIQDAWMDKAMKQSLSRNSAKELQSMGLSVSACTDIKTWFKIVNPEEAKRRGY